MCDCVCLYECKICKEFFQQFSNGDFEVKFVIHEYESALNILGYAIKLLNEDVSESFEMLSDELNVDRKCICTMEMIQKDEY